VFLLTRLSAELRRLTRELHKLVIIIVAAQGKVPPDLLKD
jgi:hypothetical protein